MYSDLNRKNTKGFDARLIIYYFALVFIGWITIYSTCYIPDGANSIFDISQPYCKQLIWIGSSLLIGIVILLIDKQNPYTLANLEPQTAYNVKVTANCEETTSEESNVADFTTYPDGVNHYELDNTAIFPNPTTGQFTIQNVQCTIESVEIIDVYGKLLSNSEVNDHTFTININNYASGVYFVRIYTDMGMVTKEQLPRTNVMLPKQMMNRIVRRLPTWPFPISRELLP